MINAGQIAIIKKDISGITSNKRMFSVLLIVPLVMTVFLPTVFILTFQFTPADSPDFAEMLPLLGAAGASAASADELRPMVIKAILNNILPLFFLLIPIMASTVMAAGAFVGEKEKSTLETLLYCPLPLKDIFGAKIMASFLLSAAVSALSFIVMLTVVEAELFFITGAVIMPDINWPIILFLVSPSVSLLAINLIVRGSAKAQSSEESQQRSVFLVLPIILLAVGQFAGVMLLSPWLLLAIGLALAAIAVLLFRGSFGKFQYENLLR